MADETSVEETTAGAAPEETKKETNTPAAAVPEKSEEAEVEVPKKFKPMVEFIEELSVAELFELVKIFEKKFGVSAAAVSAAAPGAAAGGAEEAKTSFNVELSDVGANKIAVIKAVKEALGLGLKEAKDLVDGAPSMLKENAGKEDADTLKAKIEEAGGKITLK